MRTTSPYTNMFTQTKCLSFEELSAYAKGSIGTKKKNRIEQHLTDCELCSAAASGLAIAPVTSGDITDLHKSIDSMSSKKAWYATRWSITGAVLLIGAAVWLATTKPIEQKKSLEASDHTRTSNEQYDENYQKVPRSSFENETGVATDVQKSTPRENFIKPSSKKETAASTPVTEPGTQPVNMQPITPREPEIKQPVEEPDMIVEQKYNAPVRYIEDLKVTNYEKYYFKAQEITRHTGANIPAYRENKTKDPFAEIPETERSVSADEVLTKGLKYFNKKNWAKAAGQFDLLLEVNKNDVNALFYKGVCAWNLDRPLIAQNSLMQVLASDNNVFKQEAKWYLALTYVKAGEMDTAREMLQEIVKDKGFYTKRAKEMLGSLQ
jgi:hypothetical protein